MTDLLDLETIGVELFRGRSEVYAVARPTTYGGLVAAQALMAAGRTVAEGRLPHSLHGYFLRAGQRAEAVDYRVERVRDGRSYSVRRVSALQQGVVIFDMTASFQVERDGADYAVSMPSGLAPPAECRPDQFSANVACADALVVPPIHTDARGTQTSGTLWLRIRERLAECLVVHSRVTPGLVRSPL